ncbi:MAG: hypothetical protein ACE5I5_18860 [Candidatus Heimdallarchaeota archaeon]
MGRRKKKGARGGKKKRLFYLRLLLLAIFIIGLLYFILLPILFHPTTPNYDYVGKITNVQFIGTIEGIVLEDRDCDEKGNIHTCTAVIIDKSGQVLHFKYTTDISIQRCFRSGDRVIIERINEDEVGVNLVE